LSDPSTWPNSCHIDRFSPDDGMDYRSDDDPMFQGTVQNCAVICLSLGSKRIFSVRRIGEVKAKNTACQFDLEGGDLCTMEGMTQLYYHHKLSHQGGARLNLTFRWIVNHRCGR